MPDSVIHPRRLLTLAALALIPVGAMATMTTAGQASADKLCTIEATREAGMIRLDAQVHANKALAGSYTLQIEKSGGGGTATISQGGEFDARPGQAVTLTSVSVDAKGTRYKAVLDVEAGGKSFRCTRQSADD